MPQIPTTRPAPRPAPRRAPARPPARPPADPFAPLSEQAIRARATADVRAQVDPILKQIQSGIEARTKQGSQSIAGYTSQLADSLGGYEGRARDIYSQAQASQSAADEALAAKLGGGAAGMLAGRGSASLSRLISDGAGEQAFAAKQPGIARMGGQQQLGALQRQSQADLAEQTGAVTSRVPGLIAQLLGDYRGIELDKAEEREDRFRDRRDYKFDYEEIWQKALGERADRASDERIETIKAQARHQETQAKHRHAIEKAKLAYQHSLTLAKQKYEQSERSQEDAQRFKAAQAEAERTFRARQAELNRKAYAPKQKSGGSGLVP